MKLLENLIKSFGEQLAEPMSAIGDWFLGLCALFYFIQLRKLSYTGLSQTYWSKFFLFVGLSTFLGGCIHAVFERTNNPRFDLLWVSMQFLSGLSVYSIQLAVIHSHITASRLKNILIPITKLQLFVFIPLMLYYFSFRTVAVNIAIGLIELCLLYLLFPIQSKTHNRLILTGVFISFVTVFVHETKLSFSKWFDHNDISHVIMFISLLLMYKGVRYKAQTIVKDANSHINN